MADFEIACATKFHPHRHVTSIGDGTRSWSVPVDVYAAMDGGDRFHTVSPMTRRRAEVVKEDCRWCGYHTVRSVADDSADHNLDNMPNC